LNQHNFCTSFITCHRWTWVFEKHYFFVFFLRLAIFPWSWWCPCSGCFFEAILSE